MTRTSKALLVVLAGEIAAGKTSVAMSLADRLGAAHVKVRDLIAVAADTDSTDRDALQRAGSALNGQIGESWLAAAVRPLLKETPTLIVDSVRTQQQAADLRSLDARVVVVYLEAEREVRNQRYRTGTALDPSKVGMTFEHAGQHEVELSATEVRAAADVVVETNRLDLTATVAAVAAGLGDELHTATPCAEGFNVGRRTS